MGSSVVFCILGLSLLAAPPPSAAQQLRPATRALLETALGAPGPQQLDALRALPEQPDWQAVLDDVMAAIARAPSASQNDRALVVEFIARRRIDELKIDVGPLLTLLESRSWTNQQKAAQAIVELASRPTLFEGRMQETVSRLIRLTSSQRGRVVDPALSALTTLTGQQRLERDPDAWVRWYKERYGAPLDLAGSVHEVLAVIRRRGSGSDMKFSLNGGPWSAAVELIGPYRQLQTAAADAGVEVATVVVVPEIRFDEAGLMAQVEPLRPLFKEVQPSELTFSPPTDEFYPLFEPALPRKRAAVAAPARSGSGYFAPSSSRRRGSMSSPIASRI